MLSTIKSYIKRKAIDNKAFKQQLLKFIFRKKPYQTRVRWFVWMMSILPHYLRRGINVTVRLDLVPFNAFKFGKFAKLEKNVVVNNGMGDVSIADEVQVGIGSVIIGPVKIGKYTGISQYVRILGMHHGMEPHTPHHHLPCTKAPIELGEDVFIGTGSVIMGKKNGETLKLGDYCRIGANSVVMDDIPPYSVAVGNPAKVVRVWDHRNAKWVKPGNKSKKDVLKTLDYASNLVKAELN